MLDWIKRQARQPSTYRGLALLAAVLAPAAASPDVTVPAGQLAEAALSGQLGDHIGALLKALQAVIVAALGLYAVLRNEERGNGGAAGAS